MIAFLKTWQWFPSTFGVTLTALPQPTWLSVAWAPTVSHSLSLLPWAAYPNHTGLCAFLESAKHCPSLGPLNMLFFLPRILPVHLFLCPLFHFIPDSADFPGRGTEIALLLHFSLMDMWLMPCYVLVHFCLSAPLEGHLPKVRDFVLLTAMHFYCQKSYLAHSWSSRFSSWKKGGMNTWLSKWFAYSWAGLFLFLGS